MAPVSLLLSSAVAYLMRCSLVALYLLDASVSSLLQHEVPAWMIQARIFFASLKVTWPYNTLSFDTHLGLSMLAKKSTLCFPVSPSHRQLTKQQQTSNEEENAATSTGTFVLEFGLNC